MDKFQLLPFDPAAAFTKRELEFVKWVRCGERDDYVWAKVIPPFERHVFATSHPVDTILLGTRHEGESLRGGAGGSRHVYVCIPKSPELLLADSVNPNEISILNWAVLEPVGKG